MQYSSNTNTSCQYTPSKKLRTESQKATEDSRTLGVGPRDSFSFSTGKLEFENLARVSGHSALPNTLLVDSFVFIEDHFGQHSFVNFLFLVARAKAPRCPNMCDVIDFGITSADIVEVLRTVGSQSLRLAIEHFGLALQNIFFYEQRLLHKMWQRENVHQESDYSIGDKRYRDADSEEVKKVTISQEGPVVSFHMRAPVNLDNYVDALPCVVQPSTNIFGTFSDYFRFVFQCVLLRHHHYCSVPFARTIPMAVAVPLLRGILGACSPVIAPLCRFFEDKCVPSLSLDHWMTILQFSQVMSDFPIMGYYRSDDFWPILLDEFVVWCRARV